MSKVGMRPIKIPDNVKLSREKVDPREARAFPVVTSEARFKQMLKRRPSEESIWQFGDCQRIFVEGPLGVNTVFVPSICDVEVLDGTAHVICQEEHEKTKLGKTLWGTTRGNLQNAVTGVAQGWRKELELHGVGFKARVEQAKELKAGKGFRQPSPDEEWKWVVLRIGFAHEVNVPVPDSVRVILPNERQVVLFGRDKRLVGQIACRMRLLRKPDAYKGKGIRYVGETVRLKAGKKR